MILTIALQSLKSIFFLTQREGRVNTLRIQFLSFSSSSLFVLRLGIEGIYRKIELLYPMRMRCAINVSPIRADRPGSFGSGTREFFSVSNGKEVGWAHGARQTAAHSGGIRGSCRHFSRGSQQLNKPHDGLSQMTSREASPLSDGTSPDKTPETKYFRRIRAIMQAPAISLFNYDIFADDFAAISAKRFTGRPECDFFSTNPIHSDGFWHWSLMPCPSACIFRVFN